MRNEIIEKNQTVIMKALCTTVTGGHLGMYARLIAPFSSPFSELLDGKHVTIQTWNIQLSTGEHSLARMIDWQD